MTRFTLRITWLWAVALTGLATLTPPAQADDIIVSKSDNDITIICALGDQKVEVDYNKATALGKTLRTVRIIGDNGNAGDDIDKTYKIGKNTTLTVEMGMGSDELTVKVNDKHFNLTGEVHLQGYDDNVFVANGGEWVVYGGKGNDQITTDDGDDEIYGDDGNDFIDGGGGNNTIDGGDNSDVINGVVEYLELIEDNTNLNVTADGTTIAFSGTDGDDIITVQYSNGNGYATIEDAAGTATLLIPQGVTKLEADLGDDNDEMTVEVNDSDLDVQGDIALGSGNDIFSAKRRPISAWRSTCWPPKGY